MLSFDQNKKGINEIHSFRNQVAKIANQQVSKHIVNVNFMRAELCECEFYESWAMWMWIFGELSIANVNFMRAEHCECEFYESWALRILWELSIANVNFMRAEHYECDFYESWALWMWI